MKKIKDVFAMKCDSTPINKIDTVTFVKIASAFINKDKIPVSGRIHTRNRPKNND